MPFFRIRPDRNASAGWAIISLGGIRVFIGSQFLLFMGLIFLLNLNWNLTPSQSGLMCFVFFFSILAHECGHAIVARLFGQRDIVITLVMFGGETQIAPTTNTRSLLITLAGPLASFLLVGLSLALFPFVGQGTSAEAIAFLLQWFFMLNLFWGIFNLLPIYPMDGGRALTHLFAYFTDPQRALVSVSYISLVTSALVGYYVYTRGWGFIILFFVFYFFMINLGIIRATRD